MPLNPLALTLYRDRKAALEARVTAGTLTAAQARERLVEYVQDLMRRRGDARVVSSAKTTPGTEPSATP